MIFKIDESANTTYDEFFLFAYYEWNKKNKYKCRTKTIKKKYKQVLRMVIDNIIPSGNGGINGEGRTLKEICEQPVPEKLIAKLDRQGLAPNVLSTIKADLARMGSSRVPQPAHNGHVDFSAIAWPGVTARLPEKHVLIAEIRKNYLSIMKYTAVVFL